MQKQQTFASAAWNRKGKVTRRERFLVEMDPVIPWDRLVALMIKQLWGTAKVGNRGIAKNLARAQTMFALANLYAVRHRLLPPEARCEL